MTNEDRERMKRLEANRTALARLATSFEQETGLHRPLGESVGDIMTHDYEDRTGSRWSERWTASAPASTASARTAKRPSRPSASSSGPRPRAVWAARPAGTGSTAEAPKTKKGDSSPLGGEVPPPQAEGEGDVASPATSPSSFYSPPYTTDFCSVYW